MNCQDYNTRNYINSLPYELLCMIFKYTDEEGRGLSALTFPGSLVKQVCKSWRDVVWAMQRIDTDMELSDGHLILNNHKWGNIALLEIAYNVRNVSSVKIISNLDEWYCTSPNNKLIETVAISSPNLTSLNMGYGAKRINAAGIKTIGLFCSNLERLNLACDSCSEDRQAWDEALTLIAKNNPKLKSIRTNSDNVLPFILHCREIKKLHIFDGDAKKLKGLFTKISENLSELKNFKCSSRTYYSAEKFQVLHLIVYRCQKLQKITLSCFEATGEKTSPEETFRRLLWGRGFKEFVYKRESASYMQRKPKTI